MNENEIFYPVKGYEDYLEINKNGEIYRLTHSYINDNGFHVNYKKLKLIHKSDKRKNNWYLFVNFKINGKSYHRMIHVLLAKTFIQNPDNLPEVNHKDGNKQNFSLDNLEWVSHADNMKHAAKTGLMRKGDNFSRTKMTTEMINKAKEMFRSGAKSKEIAKKLNVHSASVRRAFKRDKSFINEYIKIMKDRYNIIIDINSPTFMNETKRFKPKSKISIC